MARQRRPALTPQVMLRPANSSWVSSTTGTGSLTTLRGRPLASVWLDRKSRAALERSYCGGAGGQAAWGRGGPRGVGQEREWPACWPAGGMGQAGQAARGPGGLALGGLPPLPACLRVSLVVGPGQQHRARLGEHGKVVNVQRHVAVQGLALGQRNDFLQGPRRMPERGGGSDTGSGRRAAAGGASHRQACSSSGAGSGRGRARAGAPPRRGCCAGSPPPPPASCWGCGCC